MAMSWRSTARNTPVFRLTSPGSRTFIFRMKEAVPISTDSPWMAADQPPSSKKLKSSAVSCRPFSSRSRELNSRSRPLPALRAMAAA